MPSNQCTDNDVTLLKSGVATGPNKASATLWPVVGALASYSWSNADLAGFSSGDFNAANFGVQLSVISTVANPTAEVDYVQVTITYTVGGRSFIGSRTRPVTHIDPAG